MLLGLGMMKKHSLRVDEPDDLIESKTEGRVAPLARKHGHLCREWSPWESMRTNAELGKLHRRFAHPSATKLRNLLKKATPEETTSETKALLQEIDDSCKSCQRLSLKPRVFQVSLPEDAQLSVEVIVDMFFIKSKRTLHVIDRGIHFSPAKFLASGKAEAIWSALIKRWVRVYAGFPSVLSCDQGLQHFTLF